MLLLLVLAVRSQSLAPEEAQLPLLVEASALTVAFSAGEAARGCCAQGASASGRHAVLARSVALVPASVAETAGIGGHCLSSTTCGWRTRPQTASRLACS